MAAGDLLTAPEQREWDGALIGLHPGESDLWIGSDSDLSSGWSPTWEAADRATASGAMPGVSRPTAMYPAIGRLYVADATWWDWLRQSMTPTYVARTLAWWDHDRDEIVTVEACPRVFDPLPRRKGEARCCNVQWFVGDPTVTVVGGSS